MRIDIKFPAQLAPVVQPRLPPGRVFARLKHDYELWGLSRPSHNGSSASTLGLPETVKAFNSIFVPLTKEWQYFWVDGFSYAVFGRPFSRLNVAESDYIKRAFKGATVGWRALTNRHGWNNGYQDYINGVNSGASPMEQETINFGGNVVELLGTEPVRMGGTDTYMVRTLNAFQSPPNPEEVNYIKTPWLVMQCTISRREKVLNAQGNWDGKLWTEQHVIKFPQLDGVPVPAPFLGKGLFNYIRAERIQILESEALVPPVYVE